MPEATFCSSYKSSIFNSNERLKRFAKENKRSLVISIPTDRLLKVSFRVPSTGEKKIIDCQAVRITETKQGTIPDLEIAAMAVSKDAVKNYKDMLRKRGQ